MIAPRPSNLGGQCPQGDELAVQIIAAGVARAGAAREGACVQEYPAVAFPEKTKANVAFKTCEAFSQENAKGFLKDCLNRSCGAELVHGSGLHSHL
eukprot:9474696-Pyramimonas_sp.AAC.1